MSAKDAKVVKTEPLVSPTLPLISSLILIPTSSQKEEEAKWTKLVLYVPPIHTYHD